MNAKELAGKLNNTRYPVHLGTEIIEQAKENGLVIVYGSNDDWMEFKGAIRDEFCCYYGGKALVDKKGLLPYWDDLDLDDYDELEEYFKRKNKAHTIKAQWCEEEGYSWTYKTKIPHETFEVLDGEENYCRGIIFSQSDLPEDPTIWNPIETAPKNKRILLYSKIAGIFSGCFDCNTDYSAINPTHWAVLPPEPEV